MGNPLKDLNRHGQSIWLDYIRRNLITSGELNKLVEEDGLRGVTSNPSIFEKAIAGSEDYDKALKELLGNDPHMTIQELYDSLAIEDIQMAADVLRPVYDGSNGEYGFISLELPPDLAYDTKGSIEEARRLWKLVDRPNLMIKVPATKEGIPVIETLIGEAINVNITLMFSLEHYEAVANAYIKGLEKCPDPGRVSSVASFFLSRIDSAVDKELESIGTQKALELRGKTAIASAKLVYKRFKEIFSGERWENLAEKGARIQSPLWASTSPKNPNYPDLIYVETIVGQDTINTLPPKTLVAFRDHGKAESTIEKNIDEAEAVVKGLEELSINLNAITEKLQSDGADSFSNSFDKLLNVLEEKSRKIMKAPSDIQIMNLGKYEGLLEERMQKWKDMKFNRRLWEKDTGLWSNRPDPEITNRMGWLFLPEIMHQQIGEMESFGKKISSEGFSHVVLLGMGGSSLAPEVFQNTFGNSPGYPQLVVLDSTHPEAVLAVENKIDLDKTLFIVASKSGTTLETMSFFRYFWEKVEQLEGKPGDHFITITDPGSSLEKMAKEKGFRKVFQALPDLGGRYSALSAFGLVPGALIGLDIHKLLDRAWVSSESCAFCVPEEQSSSLVLGAALGELAKKGRDKICFLTSKSMQSFPIWLEQLIAESTGKDKKGIIPVVNVPITLPELYGADCVFVYFALEGETDKNIDGLLDSLNALGHPTIKINLRDIYDLGQEIFRWEVAVAAAGSILEIQPFNQPDVELAKKLARSVMEDFKKEKEEGKDVGTIDIKDTELISKRLDNLFSKNSEGDYMSIMAYLPPSYEIEQSLENIRSELFKKLNMETTLGFGPRFLHSTGQLHKGGPNSGIFLQLVDESLEDIHIPETDYSFRTIIDAQSIGDFQALKQLDRRILRINLGTNPKEGLETLSAIIKEVKGWNLA